MGSTASPGAECLGEAPGDVERAAAGAGADARRFAALGVVVDADCGWLIERGGAFRPVDLPGRLESLGDLLGWAAGLRLGLERQDRDRGMPDDGQVWVMPDLAVRLGLPESAPEKDAKRHRALAAARDAGWNVSELRSWMRAYREGGRTLAVVPVGWMPVADHPMLAGEAEGPACASVLACRLGLYAAKLGMAYHLNAGMTGIDLMEKIPRKVQLPRGPAPEPPKPALVRTLERDYMWQRPATPAEAALPYVHAYDANAMYLGAAQAVELGMGGARHVGEPCPFDASRPGLWRIEPGTWDDRLLPDLLDPAGGGRLRSQWFTTPTLKMLAELDYAVEPVEAYVYDEHSRLLDGWANRLRDARRSLQAPELAGDPEAMAVLQAVKFSYTAGVGMLGKPVPKGAQRQWWHRPDWRHAVAATARANLTRKLHRAAKLTGRYPLAIAVDNVLYASEHADPVAALPEGFRLGTGLGEFKPAGSARMADVVEALAARPRPDGPGNVFEVAARGLAGR